MFWTMLPSLIPDTPMNPDSTTTVIATSLLRRLSLASALPSPTIIGPSFEPPQRATRTRQFDHRPRNGQHGGWRRALRIGFGKTIPAGVEPFERELLAVDANVVASRHPMLFGADAPQFCRDDTRVQRRHIFGGHAKNSVDICDQIATASRRRSPDQRNAPFAAPVGSLINANKRAYQIDAGNRQPIPRLETAELARLP